MRYRKPKPRYDPGKRSGHHETPDDLDELKRLVGHYTPVRAPLPPVEEPWYDTRYQPSDEEPHDHVGARYRGGPDPNYQPDDYQETPAPPPGRPNERFAWPPVPPREQIPEYKDGRMTDELFQRLMRESRAPGASPEPSSPGQPPGTTGSPDDAGSLDTLSAESLDEPTPDGPAAGCVFPAPAPPSNPLPGKPQPQPGPRPPEDPTVRANQAFDEEMRDAFSPKLPAADLETRTDALFDQQMRQAFAPPPPAPFADPFPDPIGLEQQWFDQQMPMNDPFPDPGPGMM